MEQIAISPMTFAFQFAVGDDLRIYVCYNVTTLQLHGASGTVAFYNEVFFDAGGSGDRKEMGKDGFKV